MSVSCDAVMKLSDYVEGLPKVEKERYIEGYDTFENSVRDFKSP